MAFQVIDWLDNSFQIFGLPFICQKWKKNYCKRGRLIWVRDCWRLEKTSKNQFEWPLWVPGTDIESLQNRLLKVCYIPATSAGLNRLFLLQPLTVKWSKQGSQYVPLSSLYYLDVYGPRCDPSSINNIFKYKLFRSLRHLNCLLFSKTVLKILKLKIWMRKWI